MKQMLENTPRMSLRSPAPDGMLCRNTLKKKPSRNWPQPCSKASKRIQEVYFQGNWEFGVTNVHLVV